MMKKYLTQTLLLAAFAAFVISSKASIPSTRGVKELLRRTGNEQCVNGTLGM
jgi:hypothetical protein